MGTASRVESCAWPMPSGSSRAACASAAVRNRPTKCQGEGRTRPHPKIESGLSGRCRSRFASCRKLHRPHFSR